MSRAHAGRAAATFAVAVTTIAAVWSVSAGAVGAREMSPVTAGVGHHHLRSAAAHHHPTGVTHGGHARGTHRSHARSSATGSPSAPPSMSSSAPMSGSGSGPMSSPASGQMSGATSGRFAARTDPRSECARYADQGVDPRACAHDLAIAIATTAKYRDLSAAKADGFVPLTDCAHDPAGAMGVHYARADRMIVPHLGPAAPQLLTYIPSGGGWRLGAAEYEETAFYGGEPPFGGIPVWGQTPPANADDVSPAPRMFGGKTFDGPMAGHSPVQPWHYDLHVWVGIPNPAGVFAQYNPSVSC